jgi:hypothetical protein
MTTERLLDDLAAGLAPVRRQNWLRDAALLLALGAVELALFLWLGMGRHDMPHAMRGAAFWWKVGGTGVIALAASWVAIRSFAPDISPRRGLQGLAALVSATILLGWLTVDHHPGTMMTRLSWRNGVNCMIVMILLSLPFLGALALFMRKGAACRPGSSALAAGIAAACWGAFVFAFRCRGDDPLYVTVWYLAGCGAATLAARWLLPAAARW